MREVTDDLSPRELQMLTDVEQSGVHIVHEQRNGGALEFSYTVGLWHNFEQPEVIVFGLSEQVADELLEVLADQADEGKRCLAGSQDEGLLQGYPVRFFDVPKAAYAEFAERAVWAYAGAEFPVVQLVWPDKQGRWPWDAAAREGFRSGQPMLGKREASA